MSKVGTDPPKANGLAGRGESQLAVAINSVMCAQPQKRGQMMRAEEGREGASGQRYPKPSFQARAKALKQGVPAVSEGWWGRGQSEG